MKNVFKDEFNNAYFQEYGYVLIKNAITKIEINKLYEIYLKHFKDLNIEETPFFISIFENQSLEVKMQIAKQIEDVLMPVWDRYLYDPQMFITCYLVKGTNSNSQILPHQDETFINYPNENYALNCWIPLQGTDFSNGTIGVLPRSHKIFDYICPTPKSRFNSPANKYTPYFKSFIEWKRMDVGDMIIFDYRTIHASSSNLIKGNRIAISSWLTNENNGYCTYFIDPQNSKRMFKYKIDSSFYYNFGDKKLTMMYDSKVFPEGFEFVESVFFDYSIDFRKSLFMNYDIGLLDKFRILISK